MKTILSLFITLLIAVPVSKAQIDARLLRFPDVSQTHIAFVYGGDIWIVDKNGGIASKITSTSGEESFPRFSPDGKTIGYSANYHGNIDVYTIPSKGGIPNRLTYHSWPDRMVNWHPDGNSLLIASARESGRQRFSQFYKVNKHGGIAEKLPVPYGELGSYAPDGNRMAYVTRITENYPFKRYRGGLASDVLVFDLNNKTAENITQNAATDGKPEWHGNNIYFISDQGSQKRRNIWVYDFNTNSSKQLTFFKEFDINHFSLGPSDAVFEAGGKLYLLNLEDHQHKEVNINVVSDLSSLLPKNIKVGKRIMDYHLSNDAKRVVFEARGEIFNVPAENGYIVNLTKSSGALDRNPAWSPDGKHIAYWSDQSGENEIYLAPTKSDQPAQKLTNINGGFGYRLYWSPDSKKILFINEKQEIQMLDINSRQLSVIDKTLWRTQGGLRGFQVNWSKDGKWIAYSKRLENNHLAIFLYHTINRQTYQITSGYYNDYNPVFDPEGKYLFLRTERAFAPQYSNLDGTWIYSNTTRLAAIPLNTEVPSPISAQNDQLEDKKEEKDKPDDNKKESKETDKKEEKDFKIEIDGMESRLVVLPPEAGNYGALSATAGKLIFHKFPKTGSGGKDSPLKYYDLKERKEKTIINHANNYRLSGDGKTIMVNSRGKFGLIKIAPDQKIKTPLRTAELEMTVNPKEEWTQIFNDTWRRYRDLFYDPNMHMVDWPAMKEQYGALVNDALTRWDLSNILVELISELSAGHTYAGGGDVQRTEFRPTGFLGIDWKQQNGKFQIGRIIKPAPWDSEVRSPLDQSGIDVKEGDYVIAVNGVEPDVSKDPYAAFEGLSGKTIELAVSHSPSAEKLRKVVIKTLTPQQEGRLRHLEWIEKNRKMVDRLSNGQVGYMYMPNTGTFGQTELYRQFFAQIDKKGFVIDERFNSGGQLSDRFMEMLHRPTIFNLHWRNSKDHQWPLNGNDGPKVMLINGWSGSGGDAFPWAFQELKVGPIIGERTLGILVGPATGHTMIDGGYITVPDARLYRNSGEWFAEGYGIVPEIEIWDDPALLAKGKDPQLERGVGEVLKMLKTNPNNLTPRPDYEDRTAYGIKY